MLSILSQLIHRVDLLNKIQNLNMCADVPSKPNPIKSNSKPIVQSNQTEYFTKQNQLINKLAGRQNKADISRKFEI